MTFFYSSVDLHYDDILFRGYKDGKRIKENIKFKPTLFLETNKPKSKFRSLDYIDLAPKKFESIKEAREFTKKYKEVNNFKIYGMQDYIYQFMTDMRKYSNIDFDINHFNIGFFDIEVAKGENGYSSAKEAKQSIITISYKSSKNENYMCWGLGDYDPAKSIVNGIKIKYVKCNSETDLIIKFLEHWRLDIPDIITGWNIDFYDIPYLVNRITNILSWEVAKSLSPWNIIHEREEIYNGKPQQTYNIVGIQQLDFMKVFKKFAYSYPMQETYKLDHIANVVLGEKKLDYSQYKDLSELYKDNFQLFCDYNIKDTHLIVRMNDKEKLLDLVITMAFETNVNLSDTFSPVNVWDQVINNYLYDRNIIIPPKEHVNKTHQYAGAYVKEPQIGKYEHVLTFDLDSLYPHLIMQANIGPETLVDKLDILTKINEIEMSDNPNADNDLEDLKTLLRITSEVNVDGILRKEYDLSFLKRLNLTITANGAAYIKDQGIFYDLMEKMYNDRVLYKKKMIEAKKEYERTGDINAKNDISRFNNIQMSKKILLNSAYGAIGNQYFRYFKIINAEAITLSGQVAIRWVENDINIYLNKELNTENVDYIIASDTDSVVINIEPYLDIYYKDTSMSKLDYLDKLCRDKLEEIIKQSYDNLGEYLNVYSQKMRMKREVIADKGLWVAKKKYVLQVLDSEGVRYSEPTLKIMGIEAVKSSTPMVCRSMIKDSIKIILNKNEKDIQDYLQECYKKFNTLPPEDVAFPRGVNGIENYISSSGLYEKGTPIHVRGSILYNYHLKKNNLDKKYQSIFSGDKIKFIYLKVPNTIHENVIGFSDVLPEELNIHEFIDYKLQFEKTLIAPIQHILDVVGWNWEYKSPINTLAEFFN